MTKEDQKKTYFGNPNMPTFCFSMYVRVGTLGSAVFLLSLFPFSVLGDWGDGELFAVSEAGIDDIDFCGGGNWLAIAGRNPCLILRTDNYAIAKKVKGEVTSATCVRTSADGLSIAFVKEKSIEVIDFLTSKITTLNCPTVARAAVFSNDGNTLYSGDKSGTVLRWDLKNKKSGRPSVLYKHGESVSCIAFGFNGNLLASGSTEEGKKPASGSVILWDLSAGKIKKTIKSDFGGGVSAISISPSGKRIAIGHWKWDSEGVSSKNSGVLAIWDTFMNKEIITKDLGEEIIWKTEFINEDLIAVASGIGIPGPNVSSIERRGTLSIVDANGITIWKKAVKGQMVTCLAVEQSRENLAYGTSGGRIGIFSLKSILSKKAKE